MRSKLFDVADGSSSYILTDMCYALKFCRIQLPSAIMYWPWLLAQMKKFLLLGALHLLLSELTRDQ